MSSTYQGWSNYETWAMALWLDNEATLYHEVQRLAHNKHHRLSRTEAADELALAIKDIIDAATPDLGATVFADLLSASLEAIDWIEIAKSILEEVKP